MKDLEKYTQQKYQIVYLDESGLSEFMPRTHGYSRCGARCVYPSNYSNKKRINIIGALKDKNLLAL